MHLPFNYAGISFLTGIKSGYRYVLTLFLAIAIMIIWFFAFYYPLIQSTRIAQTNYDHANKTYDLLLEKKYTQRVPNRYPLIRKKIMQLNDAHHDPLSFLIDQSVHHDVILSNCTIINNQEKKYYAYQDVSCTIVCTLDDAIPFLQFLINSCYHARILECHAHKQEKNIYAMQTTVRLFCFKKEELEKISPST